MGVLNVTPDSFSDGGRFAEPEVAAAYAQGLIESGADILDVGGESTRPGATPVDVATEVERVVPVIVALASRYDVPLSIDTTKAEVAAAAIDAGAQIVNDVSGGLFDPAIASVADQAGAAYVCGHVRGASIGEVHAGENDELTFDDVLNDLAERLAALPPGLRKRTILDPCLGFGKRTPLNLELTRRAGELAASLFCPVLIGASRKRFLAEVGGPLAKDVRRRDDATVGVSLAAVAAGAHVVRVHDVARTASALRAFEAVASATASPRVEPTVVGAEGS